MLQRLETHKQSALPQDIYELDRGQVGFTAFAQAFVIPKQPTCHCKCKPIMVDCALLAAQFSTGCFVIAAKLFRNLATMKPVLQYARADRQVL